MNSHRHRGNLTLLFLQGALTLRLTLKQALTYLLRPGAVCRVRKLPVWEEGEQNSASEYNILWSPESNNMNLLSFWQSWAKAGHPPVLVLSHVLP